MKQYLPLKPVKRGFKVWAMADALNGYLYDFNVYTGATEERNTSRGEGSTYFVRVHQGSTVILRQLLLLHQPVGEASLTGHLCLRYDKNKPQEFPFGDQRGGKKVVTGRVCVSLVWEHSRNCVEGQLSRKCSKYTSRPNRTYDSKPTPKRWSSCTSPLSSLCGLVQHVHG